MASRSREAAALLLALLLAACQYSAPGPADSTSPPPPSAPTDPIDQQTNLFLKDGAVSAVVQVRWPGGEWSKAYGVRSLEGKGEAQPTDRSEVGGVTETLTAVTALKLVEDHLIGLDDPVNNVIPNFTSVMHPPGPITVRELLAQTSGIPDYVPVSFPDVDLRPQLAQPLPLAQALADAGTQPWPARSVGLFSYTETNYIALGLLVQTLRKKPFPDVLDEEVIAPLGLQHTTLAHVEPAQPDILHGYITLRNQQIDTTDNTQFAGSSSRGLTTTMADLNTFFGSLFGGRLLAPSSLALMEKGTGAGPYGLGIWKGSVGCSASSRRFVSVGIQADHIAVGIASDDGKYTASMDVAPPPLPTTAEDPSGDRHRNLIETQIDSTLNQTLDALCPAP